MREQLMDGGDGDEEQPSQPPPEDTPTGNPGTRDAGGGATPTGNPGTHGERPEGIEHA